MWVTSYPEMLIQCICVEATPLVDNRRPEQLRERICQESTQSDLVLLSDQAFVVCRVEFLANPMIGDLNDLFMRVHGKAIPTTLADIGGEHGKIG